MIGTCAAVVGLFLGLGLAKGLFKLFDAVGFTLPNSGIVFATSHGRRLDDRRGHRDAGREPAAGDSRDARAADRRGARGRTLPPSRFPRFRTLGSAILTALGFAALAYGLFGQHLGTTGVLVWMGVGALLIFVGVAMLSARFIRPLAWALGWPATRMGGAAGALARDNARRNPQRTASTAAALMIGLALVTLVAVLAAGITRASAAR